MCNPTFYLASVDYSPSPHSGWFDMPYHSRLTLPHYLAFTFVTIAFPLPSYRLLPQLPPYIYYTYLPTLRPYLGCELRDTVL